MSNSATEAAHQLGGLLSITVTPFTNGELDREALTANIERTLEHGYDGLLIGGTYGEFATMSVAERAELFKVAARASDRRGGLLLCTAGSDVRTVRELIALADSLGGYPMVMPPFVSEITDTQIEHFFREMSAESKRGIVIYNAPGTGINLSVPLIERLADIPGVVGLKQGDLNPTVVDQLVGRLKGKIRLLAASDLSLPGPLLAGFDGLTSTNSCALPEIIHASYRAIRDGNASVGGELHRMWFAYRQFARKAGQPQTVKAAMQLRGWNGGDVRPPLRGLDDTELAALQKIVFPLLDAYADYQNPGESK